MIDTHAFTPLASSAGGILIGSAAALLLLFNGRIAGVSGIASGVINTGAGDRLWRLAFLAGLILAPVIYLLAGHRPAIELQAGFGQVAIAGLVTGIGTGLGSGCTSGHGVCGLARFSRRSVVATLLFVASAVAVVFVSRHLLTA